MTVELLGTKKAGVIQRLLNGQTPLQAATQEGCSIGYVYNVKSQAQKQGVVFPTHPHSTQKIQVGHAETNNRAISKPHSSLETLPTLVQASAIPELAPYVNLLKELTETENVWTQKESLLNAIERKRSSIAELKRKVGEHRVRVIVRRMHEDGTVYHQIMWRIFDEVPEIRCAVIEMICKLSLGGTWRQYIGTKLAEHFRKANYYLNNCASLSERVIGERLQPRIEPTFPIDEWREIIQELQDDFEGEKMLIGLLTGRSTWVFPRLV
jgi:hypothetical protein